MSSDYVLPSSAGEVARLERQAALYGGTAFLDPFLAARPAAVLEIGCGTGHFTRHAAAQLPESQVVGLDQDAGRLAHAREHTGAANATFQEGDLAALPFPDHRFDLVFCRFVLGHVPDPTRALGEMARVVRPGGQVLAYEMVHDGIWFSPPKPAWARLLGRAMEIMRERGMEPSQGLHLASGMIRAGLDEVAVEVVPHHALAGQPAYEDYRHNWLETVTGLAEILGARFDPEVVTAARAELEDQARDQFLLELAVLAHGRKP